MVDAPYIRRRTSPVAYVRPEPQDRPGSHCRPEYLYLLPVKANRDGLLYLKLYPAKSIYNVSDPIEVQDYVVVYREAGKVFECIYSEFRAAVGESGVYLILSVTGAGDLYQRIPGYG